MLRLPRLLFPLICALVSLSGCGLKGPLYLPEDRAKQQAEAEQQRRQRSSPPNSSTTAPAVPTDATRAPAATPPPQGN